MCSLIDVVLLNWGKARLHTTNIYNCSLHNCSFWRIALGYFITVYSPTNALCRGGNVGKFNELSCDLKKKTWVIAFLSISRNIFSFLTKLLRRWVLKFALRAVLEQRKHELYRHCVLLFCVHLVMSIRCGSFRMLLLLAKADTKGQNCFAFSFHFDITLIIIITIIIIHNNKLYIINCSWRFTKKCIKTLKNLTTTYISTKNE